MNCSLLVFVTESVRKKEETPGLLQGVQDFLGGSRILFGGPGPIVPENVILLKV